MPDSGQAAYCIVYEADAVLVQSGNVKGWVPLPALTAGRTEVVEFTGAIVRIMRGDWKGARSLLSEVLEKPDIPPSLQLDALVRRGFIEEMLGEPGLKWFKDAVGLDPLNQARFEFALMAYLTDVKRSSGENKVMAIDQFSREVRRYRSIFGYDSEWLANIEAAGRALSR